MPAGILPPSHVNEDSIYLISYFISSANFLIIKSYGRAPHGRVRGPGRRYTGDSGAFN